MIYARIKAERHKALVLWLQVGVGIIIGACADTSLGNVIFCVFGSRCHGLLVTVELHVILNEKGLYIVIRSIAMVCVSGVALASSLMHERCSNWVCNNAHTCQSLVALMRP